MTKELELLQEIKDIVVLFKTRNTIYMGGEKSETFNHKNTIGNEFKGIFEIVEKSLKALEIIKGKLVDVSLIKKYDFVEDYNSAVWISGRPKLVKEEYETIKEVLE